MNTVSLNGTQVTDFQACTQDRDSTPAPAAVTLTASVELTTNDLVAALFRWEGASQAELDHDDDVRLLIAEAVLNGGLAALADTRVEMALCQTGTDRWDWLQFCRLRVAQLYPDVPEQTRRPIRRRADAAVAAETNRELVTA